MKDHYKKENLEKIVAESYSIAEVIRKIGLVDKGSTFNTIKKYISLYELDTSHFRGQTWNKGMGGTDLASMVKLSDVLQENVNYKPTNLKKRLIADGIKENVCEICGCNGEWQGKPITLELHHINGNHYDNRIENLQILCPNCHSQTNSFRRRNEVRGEKPKTERKTYPCICKNCGKEFNGGKRQQSFCGVECYYEYKNKLKNKVIVEEKNKIFFVSKETLEEIMKQSTTIKEIAEKLSTSRTTIRKSLKEYELYDDFKKFYSNHLSRKKNK